MLCIQCDFDYYWVNTFRDSWGGGGGGVHKKKKSGSRRNKIEVVKTKHFEGFTSDILAPSFK